MTPLIFLDVDGVLNDHNPHPNGYCGMVPHCVGFLKYILRAVPDAKIVVSSAWRYLIPEAFTLKGFEYLLTMHGGPYDIFKDRVVGVTERDEAACVRLGLMEEGSTLDYAWLKENGCRVRAEQIEEYVRQSGNPPFVVLDDLNIGVRNQVQTDGAVGLSALDAVRAVQILQSGCGA